MNSIRLLISITACLLAVSAKSADNMNCHTLSGISIPFVMNPDRNDSNSIACSARTFAGSILVSGNGRITYRLTAKHPSHISRTAIVFSEQFDGNPLPAPIGKAGREIVVSSFRGKDPRMWQTTDRACGELMLGQPWPGIDVSLRAHEFNVEKIFQLAPHANPGNIRVVVPGAARLQVNTDGELIVHTSMGKAGFTSPVAFQVIGGELKTIRVAYSINSSGNAYGFRIGTYDPRHELVIDPLLSSTFLGGSGTDHGRCIARGPSGDIYIAGKTQSIDFPVTTNGYDTTYNDEGLQADPSYCDIFVARLDSELSMLKSCTYIGGDNQDIPYALNVDASGNVYVAGKSLSSDFPTTPGCYDLGTYTWKPFICNLSENLSSLQASTRIGGGSTLEIITGVVADESTNVFAAGYTLSSFFPTTAGAYDTIYNADYDGFVVRFDKQLTRLIASTYLGGERSDFPMDLALDGSTNVIVTGSTLSENFPVSDNAYDRTHNSVMELERDVFVTKLDRDLGTMQASTFIGGSDYDSASSIAVDDLTNIYVTGKTRSTNYPVSVNAFQRELNASNEVFVSSLDGGLSELRSSTFIGGNAEDEAAGIALDCSTNIYLTGTTGSTNFPVTIDAVNMQFGGGWDDGFLCKLTHNMDSMLYSTYVGSRGIDEALAITVDAQSNAYVAGYTSERTYQTTPGAYDTNFNGTYDAFVSKFGGQGLLPPENVSAEDWRHPSRILIEWEPVENAMGYEVYRSITNVSGNASMIVTTTNTSVYDTSASRWTNYYYWVRATNRYATSAFSDPDSGSLRSCLPQGYSTNRISDMAVFDTASGQWYIQSVQQDTILWQQQWGWENATVVPGDYDGDGVSDLAVYNPQTGRWYIKGIDSQSVGWTMSWGFPGGTPVPGDYDGDLISDFAIYQESAGLWYIRNFSGDLIAWEQRWGGPGMTPVAGDYDGDARSDIAVIDGNGCWFIRGADGNPIAWNVHWGWEGANLLSVPGDYNGDHAADLAVFDTSTGFWFIHPVGTDGPGWAVWWGWQGARPVPGDYNGDGITDLAVFNTESGHWYIRTMSGEVLAWEVQWGWQGALPVRGAH